MSRLNTPTHRRGVTLIEAIMVIVLLASAAVATSFAMDNQWMAERHVVASTHEVVKTLEAARNTAIMRRSAVRIRRQRVGGVEQLRIREDAGPLGPGKTWITELDPEIRLRGGPREIRFAPTGGANRALRWIVTESRTSAQVNVSPSNGRVTSRLP